MELISLHVPKCAGDSLWEALGRIYGDSLFADYERDKILWPDSPFNVDPEGYMQRLSDGLQHSMEPYRCIHGHFYIRKYDRFKQALRITMLRDPVDRVISHYVFLLWKNRAKQNPLQRQILEQNLDVVEFSRLPLVRYLYTRQFFREVDMGMFDAIGNFSDIPGWCATLERLIGQPVIMHVTNNASALAFAKLKQEILAAPATLAGIRDNLKEDIEFYQRYCY